MATTDLKLDEPGTLPRPGPIGRLVRLAFGALCISFVIELLQVRTDLFEQVGHVHVVIWNGLLPALFLISYVVNIGYSKALKKWPAAISAVAMMAIASLSFLATGSGESIALARALWLWELYLFGHLGAAFLLAAAIATPGCEMRAIPHLFGKISGRAVAEHHCPASFITRIDAWESKR